MIDRHKMREAAEKARAPWETTLPIAQRIVVGLGTKMSNALIRQPDELTVYAAIARPSNILALLDRLDRVEGLLRRAGEALAPFAEDELHECLVDGTVIIDIGFTTLRFTDTGLSFVTRAALATGAGHEA